MTGGEGFNSLDIRPTQWSNPHIADDKNDELRAVARSMIPPLEQAADKDLISALKWGQEICSWTYWELRLRLYTRRLMGD